VLALVGVYGVVSYGVSRRRGEIGLRKALGARTVDTYRLVLGRTAVVVAAGAAAGVALSQILAGLVRDQLFGVAPGNVEIAAGTAGALMLGALAAAMLPAARAARIAPTEALRQE
jgi:putative ABC transport system permease protein